MMRSISPKLFKFFGSLKGMALLAMIVGYTMLVDTNLQERRLVIAEHYERARSLIAQDQECNIDIEDGDPAPDDAVKTLLTSYPGSGKRFTWTVIKALTMMVSSK